MGATAAATRQYQPVKISNMRHTGTGTQSEIQGLLGAIRGLAGLLMEEESLLSMRLIPSLQVVDAFRAFALVYLTRRYSRQLGDKLATVCHELLENAVHHGTADRDVVIDLRATSSGSIEVRVINHASEDRIAILHERVQSLTSTDTAQLYRQALRGTGMGKSMLGLVRIRHEAGMTVDVVSDEGRVMVCARLRSTTQR